MKKILFVGFIFLLLIGGIVITDYIVYYVILPRRPTFGVHFIATITGIYSYNNTPLQQHIVYDAYTIAWSRTKTGFNVTLILREKYAVYTNSFIFYVNVSATLNVTIYDSVSLCYSAFSPNNTLSFDYTHSFTSMYIIVLISILPRSYLTIQGGGSINEG